MHRNEPFRTAAGARSVDHAVPYEIKGIEASGLGPGGFPIDIGWCGISCADEPGSMFGETPGLSEGTD